MSNSSCFVPDGIFFPKYREFTKEIVKLLLITPWKMGVEPQLQSPANGRLASDCMGFYSNP